MSTPEQLAFLSDAFERAQAAEHVFPEMAACEAALESAWDTSELAKLYNNLFGPKQQVHPIYQTVTIPTKEFLSHQ